MAKKMKKQDEKMKDGWKIGILISLIIVATITLGFIFQSMILVGIGLTAIPLSIFVIALKGIIKRKREKKIKRGVSILLITIISIIFVFFLLFMLMLTLSFYLVLDHCGRGDCLFESTNIHCTSDNNCYEYGGLYCDGVPSCNLDTNKCENVCKYDVPQVKCIISGGKYYPVTMCI
jgi:amino acid transporter